MTTIEVLVLARSRGVVLWAGSPGRLRWRCQGQLPDDLRDLLVEHKPALLAILPPAWDQAESGRLLAEARRAVAHAEADHKAGRITAVRLNVVRLWLEVCEVYDRDHEWEARRGWDVMPLLRAAARHAAEAAGLKLNSCGTEKRAER